VASNLNLIYNHTRDRLKNLQTLVIYFQCLPDLVQQRLSCRKIIDILGLGHLSIWLLPSRRCLFAILNVVFCGNKLIMQELATGSVGTVLLLVESLAHLSFIILGDVCLLFQLVESVSKAA